MFTKRWWRSALSLGFLTMAATTAEAQSLAGSFEQLQVLVKPGDTISVTDGVRAVSSRAESLACLHIRSSCSSVPIDAT